VCIRSGFISIKERITSEYNINGAVIEERERGSEGEMKRERE
jgi:hypothetical protein